MTGGGGMTGSNLVRRLVSEGGRPTLVMRPDGSRARLAGLEADMDIRYGDVTDADTIAAVIQSVQPTVIFHLAGSFFNPPTLSAAQHMNANAIGTINVCDSARSVEGVRVVTAGSCSVYGGGASQREDAPMDPGSMFGASKAASTMVVRNFGRVYGLKVVELRLFTPFGPWESARRLIPYSILSALNGEDVKIGHGGQMRDFVYMDDVVDAFLRAAKADVEPGDVINIGSGVGRSIRDVVMRVLALMGDPVQLLTGAFPTRPDEIWTLTADIAKADRVLGWRPQIDFDEGLRRTIAWFRAHADLKAALN